ncbi:hypothetical protein 10S7_17 [uncultured Caudovirales phage]|uniref:Uncharacterized protein n=1 Tax=uncultured Caudovirales phage TaxID=2100421 RepID=A0A2H4JAW4_9CAUD|nr:hypothetical protein 10S7_17 [uncultured Caudovirales phage]
MRKAKTLESFSVESLNLIHKYFGISFDVQAGKITGANIEGNESKPTRKISIERLLGLLRRHGVNFDSVPDINIFTHIKGDEN